MFITFEYSENEWKLIRYFGLEAMAPSTAPFPLMRIMAELAFIKNDQSEYANSLRRLYQNFGKIYRQTPEWEALITV